MTDWQDILSAAPAQGQRILAEFRPGVRRITSYDRFCYAHWGIRLWKPMPTNNREPK